MAPTVTAPSQRSLHRGWGSRRRRRTLARRLTTLGSGGRAGASDPMSQQVAAETPRIDEPDSIERIASALLDDDLGVSAENDGSGKDPNTAIDRSPSCASPTRLKSGQLPQAAVGASSSPFTMHPILSNEKAAQSKKKPLPFNDLAARNTAMPLAQSTSAQLSYGSGSRKQSRASELTRVRPDSQKLTLSSSEYCRDARRKCINQPPRPAVGGTKEALDPNMQDTPAPRCVADAEEISEKVNAMLAATEALKPSQPQPRAPSSPKMTLMVHSRVFSKVSNVWERISSKPSPPVERVRSKLRKQPRQEQAHHPVLTEMKHPGFSFVDEEPAPTSSGEARFSHGKTVVGGKARTRLGGAAALDVFSDEHRCPPSPGSPEEQRAPEIGATGDDAASHHDQDPFQMEKGFELNLEDRILSTAPIGCSTPRAQSNGGSTVSSTEDSANNASSEAQLKLARVVFKLEQDGAARGHARQVMLRPSESRKTVAEAGEVAPQLARPRSRIIQIRGCERVKKHPSPSKTDLEQLELALQRNEAVAVRPRLVVKNGNRLIRNRTTSVRDMDPLAQWSPRKTCKSRGLTSSSQSSKARQGVRLAAPYRPAMTQPEDCDELL